MKYIFPSLKNKKNKHFTITRQLQDKRRNQSIIVALNSKHTETVNTTNILIFKLL